MFDEGGQTETSLDLMAPMTCPPDTITLKDFLELTGHLPPETPLVALVFDEDDVEYAKPILSAAVRVERTKGTQTSIRIELKVKPDFWP